MSNQTVIVAMTWFFFSLSSGAHSAVSTFASNSEGWTAQGDSSGPLSWSSTGGNPGGHVFINDAIFGGVTYFVAPAAFLGDKVTSIGTNLTFDLKQVYPGGADQFNTDDIILRGNGLTIAYDLPLNPANGSWSSFSVPLSASGWRLASLSGSAVTAEQFSSVMSNLTALQIRAEYQTGADTGFLDNVTMIAAPVPEPEIYMMMGVGLAMVGWATRRRRRQAQVG